MIYYNKTDLKSTTNAVYSFYISESDHKNILRIACKKFNIKNINMMGIPVPKMIYSKESGKNTYNILGKEFKLTINSLIYYPEHNVLFALIKLKKNWTCQTIPHIVLLDSGISENIINYKYINEIVLDKRTFLEYKYSSDYIINVKIGAEVIPEVIYIKQEDIDLKQQMPLKAKEQQHKNMIASQFINQSLYTKNNGLNDSQSSDDKVGYIKEDSSCSDGIPAIKNISAIPDNNDNIINSQETLDYNAGKDITNTKSIKYIISPNLRKIYNTHRFDNDEQNALSEVEAINNKFCKKYTTHINDQPNEEIIIMPDYNIVKGPRGGNYIYVDGKKKYISAKKSNLKYKA